MLVVRHIISVDLLELLTSLLGEPMSRHSDIIPDPYWVIKSCLRLNHSEAVDKVTHERGLKGEKVGNTTLPDVRAMSKFSQYDKNRAAYATENRWRRFFCFG
jgi:hypothetical protein